MATRAGVLGIVALIGAGCGGGNRQVADAPPKRYSSPMPAAVRKQLAVLDRVIARLDGECVQHEGTPQRRNWLPIEPIAEGGGGGYRSCPDELTGMHQLRQALLRGFGGCAACMEGHSGLRLACSAANLGEMLPAMEARLRGKPLHDELRGVWALPEPLPLPANPRCPREMGPGLLPGQRCDVQDERHMNVGRQDLCAEIAVCVPEDLSDPASSIPGLCREKCDPNEGRFACDPSDACVVWSGVGRVRQDVCVPAASGS